MKVSPLAVACFVLAVKFEMFFPVESRRYSISDSDGVVAVWGEQSDGAILHTPQIVTQLTGIPIVRGELKCRQVEHCFLTNATVYSGCWWSSLRGCVGWRRSLCVGS